MLRETPNADFKKNMLTVRRCYISKLRYFYWLEERSVSPVSLQDTPVSAKSSYQLDWNCGFHFFFLATATLTPAVLTGPLYQK